MAKKIELVRAEKVSFSYKDRAQTVSVLKDLSLSLYKDEIVTLFAPSGAGKSTLANLMAGYDRPTKGTLTIGGKIYDKPGLHCIVINQETDIFGWLTVKQNMELVSSDQKKIQKYLKLVSLEKVEDRWGNDLSGGMKKRLSFARALCAGSNFLILDEAFSSLDYTLRHRLYTELTTIAKSEEKTIMIITHDIDEAVHLSDRIIVLSPESKNVKSIIDVAKLRDNITHDFLSSAQGQKLVTRLKKEIE
jgi:NitT/TauT family transport system ATP-binding protein